MSEYTNYDDYNEFEEDEYDLSDSKKLTVGKIIKKTLLYSLRLLALFVFVFLMYRVFSGGAPDSMKSFIWNEKGIEAYNKDSSGFEALYYKHPDNLTKDGKFSAMNVYFVPSMGQFQITVRYNNSTLKYLAEDYKLEQKPEGEVFVYRLVDNLGNEYTDYEFISDKKNIYNYQRIVFDNVDMNATKVVEEEGENVTKKFEYLVLYAYYKEDVVLSEPYGALTVYDTEHYHEPISLSKYVPKDNKPTADLAKSAEYTVKPEPTDEKN